MFGRRIAITTMPKHKRPANVSSTHTPEPADTLDFEELAKLAKDTIIETAIGVGAVVLAVKFGKTLLNITEAVVLKKL